MGIATISGRLAAAGYQLPIVNLPRGSYTASVFTGDLLFIAGQAPRINGELVHAGQVGRDLSVDEGQSAAEICALNILAHLAAACDDQVERVVQAVRLAGIVNCAADFADHAKVLDGASDLIVRILGDQGRHTRVASGASSLPSRMAVEIEAVFQIKH